MLRFALTGLFAGAGSAAICFGLLRSKTDSAKQTEKIMQLFQNEIVLQENGTAGSFANEIKSDILKLFDEFMATKLVQQMPVLNMFIDDKLIAEIRDVFHHEMELQLPSLLQKHFSGADNSKIVKEIIQKIIDTQRKRSGKYLLQFIFCGAAVGFVIGVIGGVVS